MTYKEALDFLYYQLPMFQRQGPKAFKKDLKNIKKLLMLLDNPEKSLKAIHIAGTNGKGTSAHLLAAMIQSNGLRTGLYTSPHYKDFRERIKINGEYVSKGYVRQFVEKIASLIKTHHIQASFFEITVAMAFNYFRDQQVDYAVIETGLGGRLDSTNIVAPVVTAITNISLDHAHILGPDIFTIAHEKAGIIKEKIPVVIGRYQVDCDSVFINKAISKKAPITFASLTWCHQENRGIHTFQRNGEKDIIKIRMGDKGPFLLENITTSLEIVYQYNHTQPTKIDSREIAIGLEQYRSRSAYIGRWQVISTDPMVVADSAHNIQAIETVIEHLEQMDFDRIHFVLGFVKDKDVDKILKSFNPKHRYYFTRAELPRAMNVSQLTSKARAIGLNGSSYEKLEMAYHAAYKECQPGEMIYVGGSSFIVGDFLNLLEA